MKRSRSPLIGVLLACALMAYGCDSLKGTEGNSFVSQSGVTQIPPADRSDPLEVSGLGLDGKTSLSVTSDRGDVMVLNVWSYNCNPCIAESADLVSAHRTLGTKVPFLGIDIRDTSTATARAFQQTHGITYPSIYDASGRATLALGPKYQPGGPPTTYVVDRQGRIAAVFAGAIPSALTLVEVVKQVEAEQ